MHKFEATMRITYISSQAYLDCSVEARRVCLGLLAGAQSNASVRAFGLSGEAAAVAGAGIDAMLSGSVDTYAELLNRHTEMLKEEKARLVASYR
jgi:hypothetical protein